LTVAELSSAEKYWWKTVQKESYPREIQMLKTAKKVEKCSAIHTLCPQLDENDVMRMNGRFRNNEQLPETLKNPVILDPKHSYTKLLIQHFHQQMGHFGMELVANELRQQFWIPKLRLAIRSAWSTCQTCKNNRIKPTTQMMGNIPPARLRKNMRPFTFVGMDYFGPIHIKTGKLVENRYGVIFTCLTTRAVHLELSSSLSTDSCIMAIRRMISRRDYPVEMFSDNGTNLKGTEQELKREINELESSKISDFLSTKRIRWHFKPLGCPHMGGAWERLIHSIKTTMKAIMKNHLPNEEMLITVLVEAKAIVNSRPLTFVSLDHSDDEALTPNHFLMGYSSPLSLPGILKEEKLSKKLWRAAQQLVNHFWKRWVREYLPTLTRRVKWFESSKKIKTGSIVVLAGPSLPRGVWPKGQIIQTYPGSDGNVRVVDVKTELGIFRRPVTKICLLDLKSDGDFAGACHEEESIHQRK